MRRLNLTSYPRRMAAERLRNAAEGRSNALRSPVGLVSLVAISAFWKHGPAGWPWTIASVLAVIPAGLALTWLGQRWSSRARQPPTPTRLEVAVLRHFRGRHSDDPSHT